MIGLQLGLLLEGALPELLLTLLWDDLLGLLLKLLTRGLSELWLTLRRGVLTGLRLADILDDVLGGLRVTLLLGGETVTLLLRLN